MKQIKSHLTYRAFLLIFFTLLLSCEHKKESITKESHEVPVEPTSLEIASLVKTKSVTSQSWIVDETASVIEFTIKNFGRNVKGTFKGLKGTISFDDKNLKKSSVEGAVDVSTIDTGIAKRDKDLQSKKYFDTGKNKEIIFQSESITQAGDSYIALGNLTIKGKSQKKEIPFTFEQKGNKGVFKSQFPVNRRDYGVGGGWPLGSEVTVSLNIVVKKK